MRPTNPFPSSIIAAICKSCSQMQLPTNHPLISSHFQSLISYLHSQMGPLYNSSCSHLSAHIKSSWVQANVAEMQRRKEKEKKKPKRQSSLYADNSICDSGAFLKKRLGLPSDAKCTETCTRSASQSSSHSMGGARGHGSSMKFHHDYLVSGHCGDCGQFGRCGGFVLLNLSCL